MKKLIASCCLALMVASFAACVPGEVAKTDPADRTMNTTAQPGDKDSPAEPDLVQ